MEKQYFTISEFAKIVGISKQAIYQRLNTSLKDFVKVEQGKKYIDRKGFAVFGITELEQEVEQDIKGDSSKVEQGIETAFLLKQIEEKDKQIEFLQCEVERLTNLLEREQVLLLNEQQTRILLPEETETKRGFFKKLFGKK